jgi:hypothetical protein
LVKKLYSTQGEIDARDSNISDGLLFEDAKTAVSTRKKIKPDYKPEWVENLHTKLSKCGKNCAIRSDKYIYLKAK